MSHGTLSQLVRLAKAVRAADRAASMASSAHPISREITGTEEASGLFLPNGGLYRRYHLSLPLVS
jgi:hypothetical protein